MRRLMVTVGGTDFGRSGLGTYVRGVVPWLQRLCSEQDIEFVAVGTHRDFESYENVLGDCKRLELPGIANRAWVNALYHLVWLSREVRDARGDVLLHLAANRRMSVGQSIPSVAVVHDLAQLHVAQKFDRLRMFYVREVLTRALKRASQVVAISDSTRRDLVAEVGLAPERVTVVRNGVDTDLFVSDISPPREARPYLLYPSRLEDPGKNHVRLVQAFAKSGLAKTHDLILVGPDWGALERIQSEASVCGVAEQVQWRGYVSRDVLRELYTGAAAVVVVGLWEGFGLPALEALACGRPVLVSETGALVEATGGLAVTCDPLSVHSMVMGLRAVIDSEQIQVSAREQGPRWARSLTWEQTARGLMGACTRAFRGGALS